jgi:hypothetical protein
LPTESLGIERDLIRLLASLLDNEDEWTWGCKSSGGSGYVHHHRDLRPLIGQQRVGPRQWAESRLRYLDTDDEILLPDYLKESMLPREAGGTLSYQELSENIKKQAPLPFSHTERDEWLSTHGPAFDMMMKGDFGEGVQHLQFDIEEAPEQGDSQSRGKRSLFQSNDIDSGMGWLPSLGVIKTDVKFFLYPISSRNFEANIHLFMDIDDERVRINDVNHFLLGEFGNIGGRPCQLFLFLPDLYRQRSKGNGVEDHLKDAFISQCFIPAAEEVLGDFHLEQFGVGMREIKTDCEAAKYEGQIYGSVGSRLMGDVQVPQRYLVELWDECTSKLEQELWNGNEELMAFKGCRLLWSFKGFKYALAGRDDEELRQILETAVNIPISDLGLIVCQVEGMFDMSQMDDDDFHLDLGFMYGIPSKISAVPGDPRVGYTTLPRRCCLEDFVKRLDALIPEAKGALKIRGTYYTWCLTKDVASLTVDIPPHHPLREIGLSFVQIYPSHKNVFDCQAHYPYPLDDDSGVCLALDSHSLEGLYSTVGRPVPDLNVCRRSWRHSGQRVATPLRSHSGRSYFARIELRITRTLMRKIQSEISHRRRRRGADAMEAAPPEAGCPFYIHTTKVINDFLAASTQVPARLFQEILSLAPQGSLSIDHQKLLVQVFQLQKVAHSAVILPKFKYLFNSVIGVKPTPQEIEDGLEKQKGQLGLGLKESIKAFGYGYPRHGMVDWIELNFVDSEIAERFPHPSHALSNITARPDDRRRLKDLFQEIDFVIGRLRKEPAEEVREIQLDWLAVRLVKQYHIDIAIYMIRGPHDFVNKERHSKNIRVAAGEEENSQKFNGFASLPAVENVQRTSNKKRRIAEIEETQTDYEWRSTESEV